MFSFHLTIFSQFIRVSFPLPFEEMHVKRQGDWVLIANSLRRQKNHPCIFPHTFLRKIKKIYKSFLLTASTSLLGTKHHYALLFTSCFSIKSNMCTKWLITVFKTPRTKSNMTLLIMARKIFILNACMHIALDLNIIAFKLKNFKTNNVNVFLTQFIIYLRFDCFMKNLDHFLLSFRHILPLAKCRTSPSQGSSC